MGVLFRVGFRNWGKQDKMKIVCYANDPLLLAVRSQDLVALPQRPPLPIILGSFSSTSREPYPFPSSIKLDREPSRSDFAPSRLWPTTSGL